MTRLTRLLALALVLLLAGCATEPARTPAPEAADAQALIDGGDFAGAARRFEQLAAESREHRDGLMLRAAENWRAAGEPDEALRALSKVKRKRLSQDDGLRLDLVLAELAWDQGDAQRALDLATMPESALPPHEQVRLYRLRADALGRLGRGLESATARVRLVELLARESRAAEEKRLMATLEGVPPAELQRALGEISARDSMRPYLERSLRARGVVPLRVVTRPTREAGTMIAGAEGEAAEREGYEPHNHVALLLPMTGTLAPLGRSVRDGFFTAYFAELGPKPEVKIYDTGDSVDGALKAARRASKEGAERMVGPLSREQVSGLYDSDALTLPSLALNFPDSGIAPPRGSQQFGLPPDEEAALAAERALERGFRQVALVAAREDWAERAALAFRAQFEHGGGTISGEARLGGDVDLARALDEAVGRRKPDAIFVAVKPAAARILVPQLRARGLVETPILATSNIYGGTPSRGQDRDLDGVEFCDAPWLHGLSTGLPEREQIVRSLPASEANPRLFAFGMDAFRLLPYLDWLGRNTDAFINGASGQLSLDAFGRVRRGLAWLRFEGGVPRAADGALTPQAPQGTP